MDNKDKDNLISLLDRIKKKTNEFSDEDHSWETAVDLTLQDHDELLERIILHSNNLSAEVEDLNREIIELRKALHTTIKYIYSNMGE